MQDRSDGQPSMASDELLRRVRYWIGQVEDALDLGTTALRRVGGSLDPDWSQEFLSDIDVMRDKLDKLQDGIKAEGSSYRP